MRPEIRKPSGFPTMGIVFLLIGLAYLISNLGILPERITLAHWWPVFLIVIGIFQLVAARSFFHFPGWLLMSLGTAFFLAENKLYGVTWGNFWRFWPVVLIFLGFSMLFGRKNPERCRPDSTSQRPESGEIREYIVLGGIEKEIATDDFRGGEIKAVLGTVELDLRRAKMKGSQAELSIKAVMGNVELRIPGDWQAEVQSRSALGSVENKAGTAKGEIQKKLFVTAAAVMGNVEIDH